MTSSGDMVPMANGCMANGHDTVPMANGCLTNGHDKEHPRLRCPLCLERIQYPRVLPCLHSFCKDCISQRLNSQMYCPICHEQVDVESADTLPADTFLESMLAMLDIKSGQSIVCDICDDDEESEAIARCTECSLFLCSLHCTGHQKAKTTKSHHIEYIEDIRESEDVHLQHRSVCRSHPDETITFFCDTCCSPLCRQCTLGEHREHKFINAEEAKTKYEDELSSLLETARDCSKIVEEAMPKVNKVAQDVNSRAKKVITEIDIFIDFQITALYQRKRELRDQVIHVRNARLRSLKEQHDSLRRTLTSLNHACSFTENIVNHGTNSEALSLKKTIASRLSHLVSREAGNLEPLEEPYLHFHFDDAAIRSAVKHLGRLETSSPCPSQCRAEGGGLTRVEVENAGHFTVTLKDKKGKVLKRCGDVVSVEIEKENGDIVKPDYVMDGGNGIYDVTYTVMEEAKILVHVNVRGQPIFASPFSVEVVKMMWL